MLKEKSTLVVNYKISNNLDHDQSFKKLFIGLFNNLEELGVEKTIFKYSTEYFFIP